MKAAQDFEVLLNKDGSRNYSPYSDPEKIPGGTSIKKFKKGEDVPVKIVPDLLIYNPDYLDVEYKEGQIVLPKGVDVNLIAKADDIRKVEAKGNLFSRDDLEKKELKMGFSSFRKWAKKKFGTTDRSKGALIEEILNIQGNDLK